MHRLKFLLNYRKTLRISTVFSRHASTVTKSHQLIPDDKLTLKDFLVVGKNLSKPNKSLDEEVLPPYLQNIDLDGANRKVFFDIYGCQMNVNDIEIVWSILKARNYQKTEHVNEADVVLIMTCSIRDSAEVKIWNRLMHLKAMKKKRQKKLGKLISHCVCMKPLIFKFRTVANWNSWMHGRAP